MKRLLLGDLQNIRAHFGLTPLFYVFVFSGGALIMTKTPQKVCWRKRNKFISISPQNQPPVNSSLDIRHKSLVRTQLICVLTSIKFRVSLEIVFLSDLQPFRPWKFPHRKRGSPISPFYVVLNVPRFLNVKKLNLTIKTTGKRRNN